MPSELPDGFNEVPADETSEPVADLASIIEPAVGRIAVRVKPIPERSKTGLWLTPARKEMEAVYRPTQGVVVAMASTEQEWKDEDGNIWEPLYKVGETVLFGKYSGVQVKYQEEVIIILNERDVLARIKDPDAKLRVRDT